MNFPEIENTIKHLKKVSKCVHCKKGYETEDIHIVATTKIEGLFDLKCSKCKNSTIVSVLLTPTSKDPQIEIQEKNMLDRSHKKISENDILDIRNFLNTFDGDFEKIFKI